ncbi:MAG: dihydrolipoamide acetyltransferase family protein [Paracoccaceae bacterium]|nr:dihydrolipoamide acetyltransferase family protein [Paracoccaceae bacterium]
MSLFLMPSLGADMEAGTLVEQTMKPGDEVKRGDVIGAVETQKGVIEIEVFEDGILDSWLVEIGQTVPVGAPMAQILKPGETAAPAPAAPAPAPEPEPVPEPVVAAPTPAAPPPPAPAPATKAEPGTRARITPAARRLAAEKGIDLSQLPHDPNHVIGRAEVTAMADGVAVPVAAPTPKPSAESDMRSAIAAAMSRSKREIPHYYLSQTLDLTAVDAFLKSANADRAPDDRLLHGAIYGRAVAKALKKYPEFNGHNVDGQFTPNPSVHLGVAINIRSVGLVAPALFDAQDQSLDDLMAALRDLVGRVREGRFRARELSDATITLSSLGDRGVDQLYGVIYPPQVAIIGIGTPRLQPVVQDGAVTARLATTLTLSADHRVSDGHRGALFLRAIDKNLQKPEAL